VRGGQRQHGSAIERCYLEFCEKWLKPRLSVGYPGTIMGNRITYDARPDLPDIKMSNGLTSVFIEVLALAASSLASTARQHELATWFSSKDQAIYGAGNVGFDVGEIPWETESLTQDRGFLLRSIDAAKSRVGWNKLDYRPNEDWLIPRLDTFQTLLAEFRPVDIHAGAPANGQAPPEI
jgi:hypothetical protein